MCGRYTLELNWESLSELMEVAVPAIDASLQSWNIAPSTQVPVVRMNHGKRIGAMMRWGLVPPFAKGVATKYSTINARIESITTSPIYKGPWNRGQRIIMPASGFYEWHVNEDGSKQPFYIHLADQEVFGFAGLWDQSVTEDGKVIESCTIITMSANPLMADIHNAKARMPALLKSEDHEAWLSGTAEQAHEVLQPYPQELMVAYPVSSIVNSPKNNSAELVQRVRASKSRP